MKRSLLNKDLQSQAEFIVESKVIFVSYKKKLDASIIRCQIYFNQLISKNQQYVYYAIPKLVFVL